MKKEVINVEKIVDNKNNLKSFVVYYDDGTKLSVDYSSNIREELLLAKAVMCDNASCYSKFTDEELSKEIVRLAKNLKALLSKAKVMSEEDYTKKRILDVSKRIDEDEELTSDDLEIENLSYNKRYEKELSTNNVSLKKKKWGWILVLVAALGALTPLVYKVLNKKSGKDKGISPSSNSNSYDTFDDIMRTLSVEEQLYSFNDYASINVKEEKDVLSKMSFEELDTLYDKYNVKLQKQIFNILEDVQSYMNNTTLPAVKTSFDGKNKQLYMNADEIISTFIVVNSDRIDKNSMVNIFGNSGILSEASISDNYLSLCKYMNTYYSRAKNVSGICDLFMNAEDKALIKEYESKIASYNLANTNSEKESSKKDLISFIDNIYQNKEKNKGATSYILTTAPVFLMDKDLIDENAYRAYVGVNYDVTCDHLLNGKVREIVTLSDSLNKTGNSSGIYNIVKEEPRAMDEKNLRKDLERDMIIYGNENVIVPDDRKIEYFSGNWDDYIKGGSVTHVTGESNITYEDLSDEDKNFNESEKDRAKGYLDGYNAKYVESRDYTATTGKKLSYSFSSNGTPYQDGYLEGLKFGIDAGYQDGLVVYEAKKNQQEETIIEEKPVPKEDEEVIEDKEEIKEPSHDDDIKPSIPAEDTVIVDEKPADKDLSPEEGEIIDPDFGSNSKSFTRVRNC